MPIDTRNDADRRPLDILCGACDEKIEGKTARIFQQHDRNNFARYTFTHDLSDCASVFDDHQHIDFGIVKVPTR